MSDDEKALIAAVVAAPDDDTPRLVYADWLEENGRPERAEFIRLDCWLSQTKKTRDQRRQLKGDRTTIAAKRDELLKTYSKSWRSELPAWYGLRWGPFRRGMVESAVLRVNGDRPLPDDDLFASTPVRSLQVNYADVRELRRVLNWVGITRVEVLCLHREWPTNPDATATVLAEHLWSDGPRHLNLNFAHLRDSDAEVLLSIPLGKHFPKVQLKFAFPLSDDHRSRLLARFA